MSGPADGGGPAPASRTPAPVARRLDVRRPGEGVVDVGRLTLLAELLGRPDQAYPSLRVTGGPGKSSVARMVTALLGALGLKAGTFTAPHLQDVRERWRIADEPLPADDVVRLLAEVEPYATEVSARSTAPVSAVELQAALAFAGFADAPVDVGVFEAAKDGGDEPPQGDATGLVRAEVVIRTRRDGAAHSSATPAPAGAGGVVVTADPDEAPGERTGGGVDDARIVRLGPDVAATRRDLAVGGQMLTLRGVTAEVDGVYLPLHGAHQADNAALALAAVEGLLGFAGGIDPDVVRTGFAAVRLPGRLEVVRREAAAPVLLDAAASPRAAAALADALRAEFAVRNRILVLAVGDDPGAGALLAPLAPVVDHLVVAPVAGDDVPGPVATLAAEHGLTCETAADLAAALEQASGVATEEDAVVVAGSADTAGAARDLLGLPVA